MFGQNPNLPNIMSDTLPALQGSTSSEVFAQRLNDLHAACRAFIQTEADGRVRRALRNKVRASEQVCEHGDRVFYKREGKERWLSLEKWCSKMEKSCLLDMGEYLCEFLLTDFRRSTVVWQMK